MRSITMGELEADPVRAVYDAVRYGTTQVIQIGRPPLVLEPMIRPEDLAETLEQWRHEVGPGSA